MESNVASLTLILSALSLFLLAANVYGEANFVSFAKNARKGYRILLWKASCLFQTYLLSAFLMSIISFLFATILLYNWLETPSGKIIGMGIVVALVGTGIWKVASNAHNYYWNTILLSLFLTLSQDPESKSLLFRYKDSILDGCSEELNSYLNEDRSRV